jgi:GNAT superfamily N-acetyltransferase
MQLWMTPVLASRRALWPSACMPLAFELRPAVKADLAFCWPIYRDAVQPLMANWNEADHQRLVEQAVRHPGTSILRLDSADKGWVEVSESRHAVELKQLFVLAAARNNGLGTSFLNWMKERADRKRKDLLLEVLANSPARGLCERLGFKAVTTANDKVTMRY